MNAIEANNIRYVYKDGTVALNNLNFQAKKGEITAVLGANGAGKSTLFLTLNGILKPQQGTIKINGTPIAYSRQGAMELRQTVGIVFQDPDDQLFSADVYRDVSFGAMNLRLPESEVRRRVEEAMEQTGITALRNRPTHALSFGQKKRVAIAGILVMHPEIIILDEPTAGLDPRGVSDILHLCQDLQKLGITIILSTHDIDIVPLYCDSVYLLEEGQDVFYGTPEMLFENPEVLRHHHLRLPRIAHLMEVLHKKDHLDVRTTAATIRAARREILRLRKP